jgi:hypothetical protein
MANEFKVKNGIKFPDNTVQTTAATGGGGSAWSRKTANYTAVAGDKIIADTTAASFTVTLPASPGLGASILLADGGNWKTNNLTVARNSQTIEGLVEDLVVDIQNIQVELIFDGITWQTYVAAAPSIAAVQTATDNSDYKLIFTTAAAGDALTGLVNADKLYFNPSTGQLNATNFNSLSDARKKLNISTITNPVNIVQQLRGVTFDWIDGSGSSVGVVAQELEQILPDLVSTSATGEKSVSYGNIVGVLIEAIKQQQLQIQQLKDILGVQ